MRTFIIIALLSALAACYGAAVPPSEKVMSEGITIVYDEDSPNGRIMSRSDTVDNLFVLLSESSINVPAIPGKVQKAGVTYQAPEGVRISRVSITLYANLPGDTQNSPLGSDYVESHVTSRPGDAINGSIAVYRWAD
uniref:REPAT2 n=1 Tax=Spodoptera littoralis TaxID=7109 RepID=I0B5X2_SPOLI|nr:REPAT2 [Spodoptera littoralis]